MPSTSKFRQSRALKSSHLAQSALSVLHDHEKLMHCQPLVGKIEPLERAPVGRAATQDECTADHEWFRQTEYVPFLPFGLWKKKVVFENWFKDLPDLSVGVTGTGTGTEVSTGVDGSSSSKGLVEGGVRSKVYAPALTIDATFRVEKRKPNQSKDTIGQRERNAEKEEAGDEGWVLVEETEMVCSNVLVKWISVGQHRKAQKSMVESVVHEAERRVAGVGASPPTV